jgi:ATP-dependent Zn protease
MPDHKARLSQEFDLITTAFHEAGHTISGLLNLMKVPFVCIDAKMDRSLNKDLGYTNFVIAADFRYVQDEGLYKELLLREIYVNYAGLAAEKLLYKDICGTYNIPMILKVGSYLDRDRCSELISTHNLAAPGRKRYAFKKRALQKSIDQLEESWSDVKLVAHILFRKKRLTHDQLKAILTKKSEHKDFWKQHFRILNKIYRNCDGMTDKDLKYYFVS